MNADNQIATSNAARANAFGASGSAARERLFQLILKPVVSEKSTAVAGHRQVVFQVLPDADKSEIKRAVEMLFEVEVERVQTVQVRGKVKRFGRTPGQRSNWKKAYVRLAEGHNIDFGGGV